MCGPPQKWINDILRKEGARASLAGLSITQCPYSGMNAGVWRRGYRDAKESPQKYVGAFSPSREVAVT